MTHCTTCGHHAADMDLSCTQCGKPLRLTIDRFEAPPNHEVRAESPEAPMVARPRPLPEAWSPDMHIATFYAVIVCLLVAANVVARVALDNITPLQTTEILICALVAAAVLGMASKLGGIDRPRLLTLVIWIVLGVLALAGSNVYHSKQAIRLQEAQSAVADFKQLIATSGKAASSGSTSSPASGSPTLNSVVTGTSLLNGAKANLQTYYQAVNRIKVQSDALATEMDLSPAVLVDRKRIQRTRQAIDRYAKLRLEADAAYEKYVRETRQLADKGPERVRTDFVAGFDAVVARQSTLKHRFNEADDRILAAARAILDLADSRHGQLQLEGEAIGFTNQADVAKYNELNEEMQHAVIAEKDAAAELDRLKQEGLMAIGKLSGEDLLP